MSSTHKDITTLYIRYNGHPNYNENSIVTDTYVDAIFNKMEMILFTNKGEFIGDLDFGANIPLFLWEGFSSAEYIKSIIFTQFDKYIPEMGRSSYNLNVYIYQGEIRDIGVIEITINDNTLLAYYS